MAYNKHLMLLFMASVYLSQCQNHSSSNPGKRFAPRRSEVRIPCRGIDEIVLFGQQLKGESFPLANAVFPQVIVYDRVDLQLSADPVGGFDTPLQRACVDGTHCRNELADVSGGTFYLTATAPSRFQTRPCRRCYWLCADGALVSSCPEIRVLRISSVAMLRKARIFLWKMYGHPCP